jgi:hypothetical protein
MPTMHCGDSNSESLVPELGVVTTTPESLPGNGFEYYLSKYFKLYVSKLLRTIN